MRADTLPERFRGTELNTTWVSPGMLGLHGGEDRDVMRLARASNFALKMAPKNPRLAGATRAHRRGGSKEELTPQGDPLERGPLQRSPLARGGESLTLEPPWNLSNKAGGLERLGGGVRWCTIAWMWPRRLASHWEQGLEGFHLLARGPTPSPCMPKSTTSSRVT